MKLLTLTKILLQPHPYMARQIGYGQFLLSFLPSFLPSFQFITRSPTVFEVSNSLPGHFTTGATGPYPCCRKHGGLQLQRGRRGEKEQYLSLPWSNTPILLLLAHSLVTVLTKLREKINISSDSYVSRKWTQSVTVSVPCDLATSTHSRRLYRCQDVSHNSSPPTLRRNGLLQSAQNQIKTQGRNGAAVVMVGERFEHSR